MSETPVKVRFAPSPTGYLHVGSARTAVHNFLFARHFGGQFVVRIEDTDLERSKPEYIDPILNTLDWLGLKSDEEVVYQSKRADVHKAHIDQFLATGHAYYCFMTAEEIDTERKLAREEKRQPNYRAQTEAMSADEIKTRLDKGDPATIRVKIPEGEITYEDMIAGHMARHSNDIEDFVIARSDGSVTYNFAVVIDDHDMGITHVIRGNDHATNTFKQIVIYRAFDWDEPTFGHMALILRPDKKKVSKRLGDKDAGQYRDEGILPEALINCLALLGWNPKTDNEIYSSEELIERFNPDYFNAANAVLDEEKMLAFNKAHIARKSDHDLAVLVAPVIVEAGHSTKYWLETRWEYLRQVIGILKERAARIVDFVELSSYFFSDEYDYDEKAERKQFSEESAVWLAELASRFEALTDFSHDSLMACLNAMAEEKELKKAKLIHPTRLAVSGRPVGPGLYDLLSVLGKDAVVSRMRRAVEYIRNRDSQ